mgnify:CR=1 FL=1
MKRMLILVMVGVALLASGSPANANVSIPAGELAQRTRYVFEMKDGEGRDHTVYILATNEKRVIPGTSSWHRTTDRVFRGNYFAAVLTADGKNAVLQNLALFGFGNRDSTAGTFNVDGGSAMNKAYVVRATGDGQPDLLIVAQQVTGGGDANIRAFFIDDEELCLIHWQTQPGETAKMLNVSGIQPVETAGKLRFLMHGWERGPKHSGAVEMIWKFEKYRKTMEVEKTNG